MKSSRFGKPRKRVVNRRVCQPLSQGPAFVDVLDLPYEVERLALLVSHAGSTYRNPHFVALGMDVPLLDRISGSVHSSSASQVHRVVSRSSGCVRSMTRIPARSSLQSNDRSEGGIRPYYPAFEIAQCHPDRGVSKAERNRSCASLNSVMSWRFPTIPRTSGSSKRLLIVDSKYLQLRVASRVEARCAEQSTGSPGAPENPGQPLHVFSVVQDRHRRFAVQIRRDAEFGSNAGLTYCKLPAMSVTTMMSVAFRDECLEASLRLTQLGLCGLTKRRYVAEKLLDQNRTDETETADPVDERHSDEGGRQVKCDRQLSHPDCDRGEDHRRPCRLSRTAESPRPHRTGIRSRGSGPTPCCKRQHR